MISTSCARLVPGSAWPGENSPLEVIKIKQKAQNISHNDAYRKARRVKTLPDFAIVTH